MVPESFADWADGGNRVQRVYVGPHEVSESSHPFLAMEHGLPMSGVLQEALVGRNGSVADDMYVVLRVGYPAECGPRRAGCESREEIAKRGETGMRTFWRNRLIGRNCGAHMQKVGILVLRIAPTRIPPLSLRVLATSDGRQLVEAWWYG